MHQALDTLYDDGVLTLADATSDMPPFDDNRFLAAAQAIYRQHGFTPDMLRRPDIRRLVEHTASILNHAVETHLPTDVDPSTLYALENNAFIFSAFKTYHSLSEVGLSLVDESGHIKPFEKFKNDVLAISRTYNHNYLRAEYQHAVGSTLMASRWQQIERDGDRYDLQYRTAADEHVRESHRLLHGITLPPSDPFWDKYLPPNGWGCRCTAVQVRKGKYPQSDPDLSMRRGDNCTEANKQKIFRYNPGKTLKLFPPQHPYLPKGCDGCDTNLRLAYNPDNPKCQACAVLTYQALCVMRSNATDAMQKMQLQPTKLKHAENLHTGFLYCGNKDRKNIIQHCRDAEELAMALQIDNYLPAMEYQERQEIADKPNKPGQKERKQARGVKFYTLYEFKANDGTTWQLKCEAVKIGKNRITEYPYFIKKK